MYNLPHKTKQFFFVLIKICIVVAAFYFIYSRLIAQEQFKVTDFISSASQSKLFTLEAAMILLLLSGLNWFFEIKKWQKLISPLQHISFAEAKKQSLSALTAAIFTPNRIGEYGVKALYFNTSLRKRVVLINLMSSFLQMGTTIIFGFFGSLTFIQFYSPEFNYFDSFSSLALVIGLAIIGLAVIYVTKRAWLNKLSSFIQKYPKRHLIFGFIYSIIRYLIFSFQFYFLMYLYNIEITYFDAMVIITTMYLLSSILPTISIFDVVVKGSIAVYLFSFVNIPAPIIFSITTLMWLLNFALPCVIGSYYLLHFKIPEKTF